MGIPSFFYTLIISMPQFYVFPSGLQLIYNKEPHIDTTSIVLSCKVGSIDEDIKYRGASHLIEHMLFKGTLRHPNSESISKVFDDIGAYFNAYTDTHVTAYVTKCHSEDFNKCISMLFDMLCCSTFITVDLHNEKNVVIEEILQNNDDTQTICLDNLAKLVFNNTDYGRNIASNIKNIKNLSREHLFKYYKNYYVPSNLLLSVNTNISYNKIVNHLKNIGYVMSNKVIMKPLYTPTLKYIEPEKKVVIKKNKNLQQTHLAIGFHLSFGFMNRKYKYMASIIERYLAGNMSSILYIALREQAGIGYTIWSDIIMKPDQGCLLIYTSFEHSKLNKTREIIENRLEILYNQGMNKKQLQKQIDAYKKSIDIAMETPMFIADYYGNVGLYGIKEMPDKDYSINVDEINDFIKEYINPAKMLLSIITK